MHARPAQAPRNGILPLQALRQPAAAIQHGAAGTAAGLHQRRWGGERGRVHARAQDCNLVLYNGNGYAAADAVYASNTYFGARLPCQLQVSSAGGGHIYVVDASNATLFTRP